MTRVSPAMSILNGGILRAVGLFRLETISEPFLYTFYGALRALDRMRGVFITSSANHGRVFLSKCYDKKLFNQPNESTCVQDCAEKL